MPSFFRTGAPRRGLSGGRTQRRARMLLIALLMAAVSAAGMVPNAPIVNFKLPLFNEEGFKTWDLRGSRGLYRGSHQIDISGLSVREFSGSPDATVEMEMSSPEATLLLEESKAIGQAPITIASVSYHITGSEWEFDFRDRTVSIRRDVRVVFNEELSALVVPASGASRAPEPGPAEPTIIECDTALEMHSSETESVFVFTGNVRVNGTRLALECQRLEVVTERTSGGDEQGLPVSLGAFKRLVASEAVQITQGEAVARCGLAEVFPQEDRIVLSKEASLRDGDYRVSGSHIAFYRSEQRAEVHGQPGSPVRTVLPSIAPFLPHPEAAAAHKTETTNSVETVIVCDGMLEMHSTPAESRFIFSGNVRAQATDLELHCDRLEAITAALTRSEAVAEADPDQLDQLRNLVASGRVRIAQGDLEGRCGRAEVFPRENLIQLTDDPSVRQGDYLLTGHSMLFRQDQRSARVESGPSGRVRVVLPPVRDLGFNPDQGTTEAPAQAEQPETADPVETIITCRQALEMTTTETEAIFVFEDDVQVTATNLQMTCERLEVVALHELPEQQPESIPSGIAQETPPEGRLKNLLATGGVVIEQGERVVRGARAEVLPNEDLIVLSGGISLRDGEHYAEGSRLILHRGDRRVEIEGDPANRFRATLPPPSQHSLEKPASRDPSPQP